MAWSPSQNLLAWTDNEGVLTRWQGCIPSDGIDPVKLASGASKALPLAKKRTDADALFDFDALEAKEAAEDPDADMDNDGMGGIDLDNDDWILDDLGGGMDDEDEKAKDKRLDGTGIREMGKKLTIFFMLWLF